MTTTSAPISFTKPWQEAWPDLAERAVAYDALRALGCDTFAARAWMETPMGVAYERADDLLEIVTPWVKSGLPTQHAIAWADTLVFGPESALMWLTAGFTPGEAVFVHDVLPYNSSLPSVEAAVQEEACWATSGLRPHHVLLGVAAGWTVAAMQELVRRGLTPSAKGTLLMYADMRGVELDPPSIDYNRLARSLRTNRPPEEQ